MPVTTPLLPRRLKPASKKFTREITPVYWRKLIEVGVPIETARIIAWAIARYDQGKKIPDHYQKTLIRQNCHFVCRAGLWRAELLLGLSP